MTSALYLGLDVGGTKSAAVIGTAEGEILQRVQWPTHALRGADAVIADLVSNGQRLLAAGTKVQAVGVAIGGPLDADSGIVRSPPNLPGWDRIPLRSQLADKFGLPVTVMHDATACALAEYCWGIGQSACRLVYLTCGTGFGAGMVFDGRPYFGANGRPADIGNIRIADDGPVAYGRPGTAEGFCAAGGLGRLAAWKFPERWSGRAEPAPEEIANLAAEGDANATAVIALNAASVGRVAAMLADVLYPGTIILGSLAHYLGEPWIAAVRTAFEREAMPDAARACRICAAGLGDKLQDCSALAAAMRAIPNAQ